jgi:hypothetical protein
LEAQEGATIFEYAPRSVLRAAVKFSIWPVTATDENAALLTIGAAGERGGDGVLPDGNHNRGVEKRLKQVAMAREEAGKAHAVPDSI